MTIVMISRQCQRQKVNVGPSPNARPSVRARPSRLVINVINY